MICMNANDQQCTSSDCWENDRELGFPCGNSQQLKKKSVFIYNDQSVINNNQSVQSMHCLHWVLFNTPAIPPTPPFPPACPAMLWQREGRGIGWPEEHELQFPLQRDDKLLQSCMRHLHGVGCWRLPADLSMTQLGWQDLLLCWWYSAIPPALSCIQERQTDGEREGCGA